MIWNADEIGAVSLAVFICLGFVAALIRGWVVLGKHHREIITRLDARAQKDAETIALLSQAVTERQSEDQATTRILSTLRDLMKAGKEEAT